MRQITLPRTLAVLVSQPLACVHSWKQEVGSLGSLFPLKWRVFQLLIYFPISLSPCLLIFAGLQTIHSSSSTPADLLHSIETRHMEIIPLALLYILFR